MMTQRNSLEVATSAAPAGQSPREFRLPRGPGLLSLFAAIFIGTVSALFSAAAIWLLTQHWGLGLLALAVACFCAGLTAHVWRDFRGKWGLRIVLDHDAVKLNLPAGRSLIHRVCAQRLTIPYADIGAVETRLEGYRSLGMANMQRAYALRRKSGEWLFLFEDRALATAFESSFFADVAAQLSARAGVPLNDLGMVAGRGGFLGVWGTHAEDWAAPSLPPERQAQLWRRAVFTGQLAGAASLIILAIYALRTFFG